VDTVEEFARHLVAEVRDRAIRSLDRQLHGGSSVVARRWVRAREDGVDELLAQVVADAVDETIGYFLIAIDQQIMRLAFHGSSGDVVELAEATDGLSGDYSSDDGWRSRFSAERVYDDSAPPP
jgi:hypothetical protein